MLVKEWEYKKLLTEIENYSATLFFGMNSGLIKEKSESLINIYRQKYKDSLDIINISFESIEKDKNFLLNVAYQKSIFSQKTVIKIDLNIIKEISGFVDQLKTLDADKSNPIIIESGILKATSPILKFFKFDKKVIALACYLENNSSIKDSILAFAKKYSLEIENTSIDFLATKFGNDTLITKQEIKKLALYADRKKINHNEVLELSDDNSSLDLNKLCDGYLVTDLKDTIQCYDRLIDIGLTSFIIIRALLKHFHMLIDVKKERNISRIEDIRPIIHFSRHDKIKKQIHAIKTSKLVGLVLALNNLEIMCKLNPDLAIIYTKRFLIVS